MSGSRTPFAYWTDAAIAWNAAALTIGLRMLSFHAAWTKGDFTGGPEATRMVTEKAGAALEGWFAAGKAMSRLVAPRDAMRAYGRLLDAQSALAAPGYRKARANARRLSRTRARR